MSNDFGGSLDDLIDAAAEEFFQARDQGHAIDRDQFLKKYSAIADQLAEFFSGGDLLDGVLAETQAGPPILECGRPPVSIGDLDFVREIGRGGMGVVYEATQRGLQRTVAVKRIRLANLSTPTDLERFRFEARAAAKLSHPNILPILSFIEGADELLMVMPFISGGDLRRRLKSGPLAPRTAARAMIDVARGVAHAHAHGIIHRDIKPANIMLYGDGRAIVADFGLAKALNVDSQLTTTGQIVGSPSFMAPEQASGATTLTRSVDVYSMGATLYALLVGKPPFEADTPFATLDLVRDFDPVPPKSLNPNVPNDLQAIVMKCLQKSPADRYPNAREFAADLQRFLDGERVRAEPLSVRRRLQSVFGKSRNHDSIEDWAEGLTNIGFLAFVAHVFLEAAAVFSTDWLMPRLLARILTILLLAKWLKRWRRGRVGPTNPFERAIWAVWSGYLLAVLLSNLGLAAHGRPRGETIAVESLLAGLAFIATGGLSWGGCYAGGGAFLALSLPAWFTSYFLDVAFGFLWLITLIGVAKRGIRDEEFVGRTARA